MIKMPSRYPTLWNKTQFDFSLAWVSRIYRHVANFRRALHLIVVGNSFLVLSEIHNKILRSIVHDFSLQLLFLSATYVIYIIFVILDDTVEPCFHDNPRLNDFP
jgi:hypothetical protein